MLRGRDPASGLRDFEAIVALAGRNGLVLQEDNAMPANNRLLVLQQELDQAGGAVPALAAARLEAGIELVDERRHRQRRAALASPASRQMPMSLRIHSVAKPKPSALSSFIGFQRFSICQDCAAPLEMTR